jgi:hypothetical protein
MRTGFVGVVLLACLVLAQPALAQRCEHSRDINLTADAAGVDLAIVIAGAGDLVIEGGDGDQIVIEGRACASDAGRLDEMSVKVGPRDDRVTIETEIPDGWSWTGGRYAYIDLHVRVPSRMALRVDDGSGNLVIRDVASVELEDGSGNLEISGVAGDVSIDDGSGNMGLERVGGEVWIKDGSGNINVTDAGSVVIDDDGSGNIDIDGVRGSVMVHEDGSGGIWVASVGGDFTVQDDGSGGIRHRDVAGEVKIPEQR